MHTSEIKMPVDLLASRHVLFEDNKNYWLLSSLNRKLQWNKSSLELTVEDKGNRWVLKTSSNSDIEILQDGRQFVFSFVSASIRDVTIEDFAGCCGVSLHLAGFMVKTESLDFSITIFCGIEWQTGDVLLEFRPHEGKAKIRECRWPGQFASEDVDFTVLPFMQGILIPRNWPECICPYTGEQDKKLVMAYGRSLYMPWWGVEKKSSAAMLILETPDDAGCRVSHPAGGPTAIETCWVHSLGKMRYTRKARLCFFSSGNYVTMAKRYRQHVQEHGNFISLKEKIARSPYVGEMVGSPVLHLRALIHIKPESIYYNHNNQKQNHELQTFHEIAEKLSALAERNVRRAYVHLDGFGFSGYDNLEPDTLPPSMEAGSWEGLRNLSETCRKLRYLLALHQQYRDFYCDSASFNIENAVQDESGNNHYNNIWAGGRATKLCSSKAPAYVRRNNLMLKHEGIELQGSYLDVFAVTPPDECYHPMHWVSRSECLKYRRECFEFIRHIWGIVSSEEPADWAIPHIDMVHHAPWPLNPNPGKGTAQGIHVPLFNLVYHDAIIIPWICEKSRGGWGISENDIPFLHAISNAGLPYLDLNANDKQIAAIQPILKLHHRVGLLEMTDHEFLDTGCRSQKTTFADGTTITVDHENGSWKANPPLI